MQLSRVIVAGFVVLSLMRVHADEAHHEHAADPHLQQSGQAAFAAIQEIVQRLDADPNTDWSKVNIDRLRAHLLDMNEVVMNAKSDVQDVAGGVFIKVTGSGSVLPAIQRMIPAHASMMNGYRDWRSVTELTDDGVSWTLFTSSASERTRIRGLGLFGLLTLGAHHAPHHWAMAKGEMVHGREK